MDRHLRGPALRRLQAQNPGRLPAVNPQSPRCLSGLLQRTGLERAYAAASAEGRRMPSAHQVRLAVRQPEGRSVARL